MVPKRQEMADGEERRPRCSARQKADSIGKECRYANFDSFNPAALKYCSHAQGATVLEGQSLKYRTDNNPDGFGGEQLFWGNYRVDREGIHFISLEEFMKYQADIFNQCRGFGGWFDTTWGTMPGSKSPPPHLEECLFDLPRTLFRRIGAGDSNAAIFHIIHHPYQ
ncbi:hypothetical protein LTR37_002581 [Vermiconidia calcicola]|uniref:Uncharacterized protein n=1 Tax=Vermiconidia calcicola TaxID=1690605 RepID=A0ACC3NSH7_9PEZI|nr:hypothetical protein LTR37_002581 [Vermiconidia calcicola]